MGDGAAPPELVRKRITAETKRLEFQIESQELEAMEAIQRAKTIEENIKAAKEQIKLREKDLHALDKAEGSEEG